MRWKSYLWGSLDTFCSLLFSGAGIPVYSPLLNGISEKGKIRKGFINIGCTKSPTLSPFLGVSNNYHAVSTCFF